MINLHWVHDDVFGNWFRSYCEKIFNTEFRIKKSKDGSYGIEVIVKRKNHNPESTYCTQTYKTRSEAMVKVQAIVEKALEEGISETFWDNFDRVSCWKHDVMKDDYTTITEFLGYAKEDIPAYKKALGVYTDERGRRMADIFIVEAKVPKGSLVRTVDRGYYYDHERLPRPIYQDATKLYPHLKCRAQNAKIVDAEPLFSVDAHRVDCPKFRKDLQLYPIHTAADPTLSPKRMAGRYANFYNVYNDSDRLKVYISILTRHLIHYSSSMPYNYIDDVSPEQYKTALLRCAHSVFTSHNVYYDDFVTYNTNGIPKVAYEWRFLLGTLMDKLEDRSAFYKIGDEIHIDNFDLSSAECAAGFHFFKTKDEAKKYDWR